MHKKGIYEKFFKRSFDITISLILLLILFPFLSLIALLVRIKLGKPIIFAQKRPGINEKIFTLYKFRTMDEKKDENGFLLSDAHRLTRLGKFLRATSIDELPELINVIKGDMSLVGPRPLLIEYLEFYNDDHKRRHLVKPGLTGLAQVNGRNYISWEKKLSLDIEYVDKIKFLLDVKLLFMTIIKVLRKEGINSKNSEVVEKFKGIKNEK